MVVALIESILYSAVNTRLIDHILSSLAAICVVEIRLPPGSAFICMQKKFTHNFA